MKTATKQKYEKWLEEGGKLVTCIVCKKSYRIPIKQNKNGVYYSAGNLKVCCSKECKKIYKVQRLIEESEHFSNEYKDILILFMEGIYSIFIERCSELMENQLKILDSRMGFLLSGIIKNIKLDERIKIEMLNVNEILEKHESHNYKYKQANPKSARERAAHDYGLTLEQYNELTSKCAICGFSDFVELHHINQKHEDNKIENFIGLCPNHHRLVHVKKLIIPAPLESM